MIQTILTIAVISLAVAYLGKTVYSKFFAKKTNCDGCAIHKSSTQN